MSEPYYGWALDAIQTLDWLVEVDDWAFEDERQNLGDRDPRLIDVAHVRWAASSAKTAIDLCAVELAYRFGGHDFWSENAPSLEQVRRELQPADPASAERVAAWFSAVADDTDYPVVATIRHALVHRFVVRTALVVIKPPKGHEERSRFEIDSTARAIERPDARELILLCREVAHRHVGNFGEIFGPSQAPSPPRHSAN